MTMTTKQKDALSTVLATIDKDLYIVSMDNETAKIGMCYNAKTPDEYLDNDFHTVSIAGDSTRAAMYDIICSVYKRMR